LLSFVQEINETMFTVGNRIGHLMVI